MIIKVKNNNSTCTYADLEKYLQGLGLEIECINFEEKPLVYFPVEKLEELEKFVDDCDLYQIENFIDEIKENYTI